MGIGKPGRVWMSVIALVMTLVVSFSACSVTATSTSNQTGTTSYPFGVQTKTSGCQAHDALPDSACTPGDIFQSATVSQICQSGYASSVRNVTTSTKNKVYAEYGITTRYTGEYEVDHLISLELGGSNDISNLWPELASPKPGFHEKDKVENYLHDQVCAGKIGLREAQEQIASNWLTYWHQMGN